VSAPSNLGGRRRATAALAGAPAALAAIALAVVSSAASGETLAGALREGEIEQSWYQAARALQPFDEAALETRCTELAALAHGIGLRRLTPFAVALVARARTLETEQAMTALRCAALLDPESPEVQLALADRYLSDWAVVPGLRHAALAATALAGDSRFTRPFIGSAVISLLAALLGAFVLWVLLAVRRVLPLLWHDLMELGGHWRLGANAVVVAAVALTLPLFAGGDVAWLCLWIFALCWGYLSVPARIAGLAGLLLVAAAPTLLELGFRALVQNSSGIVQATAALAERRYEPRAFDELDSLEELFDHAPAFHRLRGDLYRQYGQLDNAALAYREGLRRLPDDGPLALGLGTVRYLEGDYNAALQAFQMAHAAGADPVVVSYNLSLTFAQTYHFRESDEALERARRIDDRRLRRLTGGGDHTPILPLFTPTEARSLLSSAESVALIHRGIVLPPMLQERTVAHPLTLASLVALVFAIGHYLIRDRTTGFAVSCLKCGRAFCRRCRLSQERQSYCAQCVNIFLKKDAVGIEAQVAKRRQVARHVVAQRLERRLGDLMLPGLGLSFAGRSAAGAPLALVAVGCVAATLIWLPQFVSPILMHSPVGPLQVVFGAVWAMALVAAQVLPGSGR